VGNQFGWDGRGGMPASSQGFELALNQAVQQVRAESQQQLNRLAGGLRKEFQASIERNMAASDKRLSDLATVAAAMTAERVAPAESASGDIYIENIPGTRVPYMYVVEIPIQANDTSQREQSFTVSPEGPFVAERRWATFLSQYQFQYTDSESGQQVTLPGRSYGRYRPAHSASDYNDAQHNSYGDSVNWVLTGVAGAGVDQIPSAIPAVVSTASSFRTMQFDGRIEMQRASTDMRGQNRPVPSAWYTTETNGPIHLPALDFFPRADGVTFKVTPNHVSNPPAGNATGLYAFPNVAVNGWPFVEGQYDPHEGIATPSAGTAGDDGWHPAETDTIERLPDGYLIVALEGYKIIQVTGPQE
jgi:hypothetical protein